MREDKAVSEGCWGGGLSLSLSLSLSRSLSGFLAPPFTEGRWRLGKNKSMSLWCEVLSLCGQGFSYWFTVSETPLPLPLSLPDPFTDSSSLSLSPAQWNNQYAQTHTHTHTFAHTLTQHSAGRLSRCKQKQSERDAASYLWTWRGRWRRDSLKDSRGVKPCSDTSTLYVMENDWRGKKMKH